MRSRFAAILSCVGFATIGVSPMVVGSVTAAESDPAATVDGLHAALIQSMKAGEGLGLDARMAQLDPVVGGAFEFHRIARAALGSHWKELDAAEQERMQSLMRRLSVVTYAARFDRYDGESFEIRETKERRRGQQIVRAALLRGRAELVQLDYVLTRAPDGWRILNVLADGVSDLSLKRAQYAALIRKEGVHALLDRVETKIRRLTEENDTSG